MWQVHFDWMLWWFGKVKVYKCQLINPCTFLCNYLWPRIWCLNWFWLIPLRIWKDAGICTHVLEGHTGPVTSVCVIKLKGISWFPNKQVYCDILISHILFTLHSRHLVIYCKNIVDIKFLYELNTESLLLWYCYFDKHCVLMCACFLHRVGCSLWISSLHLFV